MTIDQRYEIRNLLRSNDWGDQKDAMLVISKDPKHYSQLVPDLFTVCVTPSKILASFSWNCFSKFGLIAVPYLLDKLTSETSIERKIAIELLLHLNYQPATPIIGEQILPDRPGAPPDWGGLRHSVITGLRTALDDPNIDVAAMSAWALDEIGESSSLIVERLIRALRSPDRTVVAWSALTLGRIGDHDAIRPLELFLDAEPREHEHGQSTRPRLAAAQAIRKLRNTEQ